MASIVHGWEEKWKTWQNIKKKMVICGKSREVSGTTVHTFIEGMSPKVSEGIQ